jgi:hypothetical protein
LLGAVIGRLLEAIAGKGVGKANPVQEIEGKICANCRDWPRLRGKPGRALGGFAGRATAGMP